MAVAESAPQANLFAIFVQQYASRANRPISTDAGRRACLSAIAELLVMLGMIVQQAHDYLFCSK